MVWEQSSLTVERPGHLYQLSNSVWSTRWRPSDKALHTSYKEPQQELSCKYATQPTRAGSFTGQLLIWKDVNGRLIELKVGMKK